jgi:hypothetical protein
LAFSSISCCFMGLVMGRLLCSFARQLCRASDVPRGATNPW